MLGITANSAMTFAVKHRVIIIALIILAIVAIYFYRKGKKQVTISDIPTDNPQTTTGNGGVNMSGQQLSVNEIVSLADQIHEDVNCVFCTRNTALYQRVASLSDTDLVRIYNAYNSKYQSKDGETMLEALKKELTAMFSSSAIPNMQSIINRLIKYNVK